MKKIIVRVQPNSREAKVEKIKKTNQHEPDYKVFLTASPQKGQANAELIEVLADYFAKTKRNSRIINY